MPPPAPPALPSRAPARPRQHRPWLAAVIAIAAVIGLVAGLLVWAPWSQQASAPLPPATLRAQTASASAIVLRWSPPTNGRTVEHYLIYRNGVQVATIAGTATTFSDTGLAPATAYRYYVVSTSGGSRSTPSATLAARTATPPVGAARLQGTWSVTSTITASGGGTPAVGSKLIDTWKFSPRCAAGPCAVTVLLGQVGGLHYTTHTFTMNLTRAGAAYSGNTTAHLTHCGGGDVNNAVVVQIAVTRARPEGRAWAASALTGTVTWSSPYTQASATTYCPAQSTSASLVATH